MIEKLKTLNALGRDHRVKLEGSTAAARSSRLPLHQSFRKIDPGLAGFQGFCRLLRLYSRDKKPLSI
jgi:hypothetical protein